MRDLRRREILIAVGTAVAILLFVAASWWGYRIVEAGIKESSRESLQTVLDTSHRAFRTWARNEREAALALATMPDIVEPTSRLVRLPRVHEEISTADALAEIRDVMSKIVSAKQYSGFVVIAPDGTSLAATHDTNLAVDVIDTRYRDALIRVFGGDTVLMPPLPALVPLADDAGVVEVGRPTMWVAAPIFNEGTLIAVIALRINPSLSFTSIFQSGRIGETGETYAFNDEGVMISESRFDGVLREAGVIDHGQRALLNVELRDPGINLVAGEHTDVPRGRQPFTRMAASALAGESGFDVDGYRDYRGVMVIGAWLWDEEYGFGLTTELDVEEGLDIVHAGRQIALVVSLIGALLMAGMAALFVASQRRAMASSQKLESALTKVLTGFLPICASCKKIRDKSGEWQPVERFVGERTEAAFTHSMCPDCGSDFYGGDWPPDEH